MTRSYWPSALKRRPGWKGVDFCLSYRCLNAPSRWGLYVALGLIAVVFGIHVAFPMRYFLTHGQWWQPIIAFLLLLSSVSSLMMTHLTDPGIIPPRPPPPASWLQKHAKGAAYRETVMDMVDEETGEQVEPRADDVKANAERILQTFYARGKIVPSGTPQLTSVYCYTCHNWRTPRTVHCSDCGVGTLRFKSQALDFEPLVDHLLTYRLVGPYSSPTLTNSLPFMLLQTLMSSIITAPGSRTALESVTIDTSSPSFG